MNRALRALRTLIISGVLVFLPVLSLIPAPAHAGTNQCSWSGGGGNTNWSTAANWSCSVGTVPTTGYDLIFPYISSAATSNNDLSAGNIYGGIWFTGTVPAGCSGGTFYTITGNTIQISASILVQTVNGCNQRVQFNASVTLTASASFDVTSSGNLTDLVLTAVALGTNNLTITSVTTNPGTTTANVELLGAETGSGNTTITGDAFLYGTSSAYSGNISITSGELFVSAAALGTTGGTTTVGTGASLGFGACGSNQSTAENIIFTGTGDTYATGGPSGKLFSSPQCGGGGSDETYGAYFSQATITLSGTLTLNNNVTVGAFHDFILSGTLSGAGKTITLAYDATPGTYWYGGALQITAGTNNTSTANGTYHNPVRTTTLSDSVPGNTVQIGALSVVTITGTRSDVTVLSGGTLKGTGTIGNLGTSTGAIIAPGMSPGVLNTGSVTLDSTTTLQEELGGTGAGQFDQLNVTGTVDLASAILSTSLYSGFVPSLNDSFIIVNNDGVDAVTGTFAGLAEGATFTLSGGYKFKVSYVGGTGNDVTLTATYVPGPPGTGFKYVMNNIWIPLLTALSGLGLVYIARRKKVLKDPANS